MKKRVPTQELRFQEIFNVKQLLVGWTSFFLQLGSENVEEQNRELPCMYLFHDLLSLNWYPTIEAKFVVRKLLARINNIKACLFCILVSFGKTSSNWILLAASNPLFSVEGYCVKWNDEVVFSQLVQMHLFGFQTNCMTLAIGLGHAILWYPWNEKKKTAQI